MQAYLFGNSDFKTNKKTVPIPVKEIQPQQVSKTESSSQGSDHTWNVTKSASPASIDIANTCSNTTATAPVTITVKWEKKAALAGGPVTITAKVLATNPAARVITVSGTDVTYQGSLTPGQGKQLSTDPIPPKDVPANTTNFEVATITIVDNNPIGITQYNDVVTMTYTDKLTQIPVPGNLQASASSTVQYSGPEANTTASILDTETISDTYGELRYTLDSKSSSQGRSVALRM